MENSEFLTESQTLAYAGIDRNILTRFCETGYIKTKMLANGQVLYSKTEIERVFGKRREVLQNSANFKMQESSEARVANSNTSYDDTSYDFDDFSDYGDIKNDIKSNANSQYSEAINTKKSASSLNLANNTTSKAQGNINTDVQNDVRAQTSNSRLIKFPETATRTNTFSEDFKNIYQNDINIPKGFDFYGQTIDNIEKFNKLQETDNYIIPSKDDNQVNTKISKEVSQLSTKQVNSAQTSNNVQANVTKASNMQSASTQVNTSQSAALQGAAQANVNNAEQAKQSLQSSLQSSLKQGAIKSTQSTSNQQSNINNVSSASFEQSKSSDQVKKLQSEVENLKQEIVKLQSYARLQKKLLEVKEKEIAELKQEKDWLKNRIETQEEKNNRDQLLILSETRVIHNLIANAQKSSPIRTALEWFGLAKKHRQETIDMIKQ